MAVTKIGAKKLVAMLLCALLMVTCVNPMYSYADGDKKTVYDSITSKNGTATPTTKQSEAPVEETTTMPGSGTTSLWGTLLQVVFALGLVVVLIYLVLRVLSKRQLGKFTQTGPFKTIAGLPLGPGKSMQLVQVGDALYLIGVGQDVQLIRHIPAGDEMDLLLADVEIKPSMETNLLQWMKQWKQQKTQEEIAITIPESAGSFDDILDRQWNEVSEEGQKIEQSWYTENDKNGGRHL